MVKIIAWNIARREEAWRCLLDTDGDIALLQEAIEPPADVARRLDVDPAPWRTVGAGLNRPWRAAVVKLSSRVGVQWFEPKPVENAHRGELAVSRPGTLAAAILTPSTGEPFIVASMYAPWEKPHSTTGSSWIYADGSVHRVISDLSALIGQQAEHRILAAGDLNILHGYGENGSDYWASRYATVFSLRETLPSRDEATFGSKTAHPVVGPVAQHSVFGGVLLPRREPVSPLSSQGAASGARSAS